MPVGVFGLLALRQKFQTPFAVTVTVLLALALSSCIEMTQLFAAWLQNMLTLETGIQLLPGQSLPDRLPSFQD